ncbi:MAG: zinc ribbon domain-containing protein [Acidobacteria bacterium]|uniref:Zinc ribbon domain-containing protein n=1 Tax=Candidatus Polarisedimenticola svalbardensis TaxID=2886004 RepID=A0A8J6Y1H7_9BACT|nr:zinc ribbon domain-containing protein [Candidatus Polarisedimenticola svalbardensis]
MPIYEYSCTACRRTFEKIQKVGARSLRKCEECGGKLEKLVSRSAFHLKGGGWFDSGYTSGGGKSATPSSESVSSSSSSSSSSTSKSDTASKKSTPAKSKSD